MKTNVSGNTVLFSKKYNCVLRDSCKNYAYYEGTQQIINIVKNNNNEISYEQIKLEPKTYTQTTSISRELYNRNPNIINSVISQLENVLIKQLDNLILDTLNTTPNVVHIKYKKKKIKDVKSKLYNILINFNIDNIVMLYDFNTENFLINSDILYNYYETDKKIKLNDLNISVKTYNITGLNTERNILYLYNYDSIALLSSVLYDNNIKYIKMQKKNKNSDKYEIKSTMLADCKIINSDLVYKIVFEEIKPWWRKVFSFLNIFRK